MRRNNTANNFWRVFLAFALGVFVFANYAEAQTKRPQQKPAEQITKQMKDEVTYEPDGGLLKEMWSRISVVESKKDWKQFKRQRPTLNKSGSRSAYIAQFAIEPGGEALIDVIVVYEKSSGKFYELRGFDFPRPFVELKWTSDDVLQFEQWVNPTNGGRYAINVKRGEIVSAGYVRSN
ncbi:MAG TPA: hypothetical protein VGB68_09880 [Pyrinomonadaceae bacterium]